MRPGAYLHRRRVVQGLTLAQAAANLALLAEARGHADELPKLEARLRRAESDEEPLSLQQAALLRNVVSFDLDVYDRLLDRDLADEVTRRHLPLPHLCRTCAYSWHDPCEHDNGTLCAWSADEDALCTRCEESAARNPKCAPISVPAAPILQPEGFC